MAITPPAHVVGATRTPTPFGLFSVVLFREGSSDRWESGVEFDALGCVSEPKGIGELDCETGTAVGLPKDLSNGGLSRGSAGTFLIYEDYVCSPIGNPLQHAEDTARARLEAFEEIRVEQALSTGAYGQKPNFADPSAVTALGEFPDLKTAVAKLEAALASEYGAQGIFHMSRETASLAIKEGVIESTGQRLRTKLGTPVIAGSGYAFEGIVATPAMFGYRSEVITSSNRLGDLLDREKNDLYGLAERNYLLAIDECGIFSATVAEETDGEAIDEGARAAIAVLNEEMTTVAESLGLLAPQVVQNTTEIGTLGHDVTNLGLEVSGKVSSVGAGDGISVDSTNPQIPIVSATPPPSEPDA